MPLPSISESLSTLSTTSALVSYTITVGTTPTVIEVNNSSGRRRTIYIFNDSTTTNVYIGASDVDASKGLPCFPQAFFIPITLEPKIKLYAVVQTGTAVLRVLETYHD
jgi:hypothetical protein